MENFLVCLNAILPIFILMALGYTARACGFIKKETVPEVNKMAFYCFMPFMMFYNIYTSDLESAIRPALIAYGIGGVLVCFFLSIALVYHLEKDPSTRGVMVQGLFRSNFVIIGLPLAESLAQGGDISSTAVMVAIIVPLFNVLAVIILEANSGGKPSVKHVLLDIAKNPLIISTVLAIIIVALGIKLPKVIETSISMVSRTANPLLLFLLGAFFSFKGVGHYRKQLAIVTVGRLVVIPGIFLTIAALLGFRGTDMLSLIGVFGSATAVSSFAMADQMGGNRELAGDIVVMTSAFCSITLFLCSFILKTLGII
jgi:predicted permease